MHTIQGDGKLFDAGTGKDTFADENLPTRDATQMTHEFANALMFEIINVIESEGISLNAQSETFAQMNQLLEAIDKKVSAEATLRADGDSNLQSQVNSNAATITINSLSINGLDLQFVNLKASEVQNDSGVSGSKVKDALDQLSTNIGALNGSSITNDSSVSGATVKDALETLEVAVGNNVVNINDLFSSMVQITSTHTEISNDCFRKQFGNGSNDMTLVTLNAHVTMTSTTSTLRFTVFPSGAAKGVGTVLVSVNSAAFTLETTGVLGTQITISKPGGGNFVSGDDVVIKGGTIILLQT